MYNLRNPKTREILFLVLVFVSLFFLYNRLNLSGNRWTLHPDDKNLAVYSTVLAETGHLWYQSPYNELFDTDSFIPGLDDYVSERESGHKIRAAYTPGVYLILSAGTFFGYNGPFYIVSLLGLVAVAFFYLILRELYGRKTAMVGTLFFGFSSAFIYWSNMLFSNVPALCFFLAGLFFLLKASRKPDKLAYYLLAVLMYALSIWIRYEFVLFALLSMLVMIKYRKSYRKAYLLYSFIFLLFLGAAIMLANQLTTQSVFGLPQKAGATASEFIVKYPTRLFDFDVLLENGYMYVYYVAPILTVLAVLGVLYVLKNRRDVFTYFFLALGFFVFYYYGKNDGFWGYGRYWMASSYTRYFLPLMMVLSVFAAILVVRFLYRLPKKQLWRVSICGLVIIAHIVTSIFLLANITFGLDYTDGFSSGRKALDEFTATLPQDTVMIDLSGGWYEKMIVSRTVFTPNRIPSDEREARAMEIAGELVDLGVPVYVFDNADRNLFPLPDLIESSEELVLTPVPHNVIFTHGGSSPIIYRLEPREPEGTESYLNPGGENRARHPGPAAAEGVAA